MHVYVCNRRHDCMWPLSHDAELLECTSVCTICTRHISDQIITLAAIRAGSKGCDSNLPASYRKLLKGTGENVAESPHARIDDQGVKIFCGWLQHSVDPGDCICGLYFLCTFSMVLMCFYSTCFWTVPHWANTLVLFSHVCTLIWILIDWLIDWLI